MSVVYDEIFSKPISEYTDEEIRSRALELRSQAKLTKGKRKSASSTAKTTTNHSVKKDKVADMLELAMNNAKKRQPTKSE